MYRTLCATIEEPTIHPTNEQTQTCLRVCQMLSNCYRDIQVFRFDDRNGEVYIFAGDELQLIIFPSGNWSFVDEIQL